MASAAVDLALKKIDQVVTNEASLLLGLDDEIKIVKMTLEFLWVFLADADQMRRYRQNETLRVWVKHLREVAYDLEDVLDEFTVKLDLQPMGSSGCGASPWLNCRVSPITQLITRHYVASQIQKVKLMLEKINENKATFHDPNAKQDSSANLSINLLRNEVEAEPIGQDAYVNELIPQILHSGGEKDSTKEINKRLVIIPISGMGGLGKTTLAKRLYNDTKIESNFNLRAWLTISQASDVVDLLRKLMKDLKVEGDTNNEEEMKRKLKEHLRKKSFLIVLDDLRDINSWRYLETIFPREHEGITVLVTTRENNVATKVIQNSKPFELKPLTPEESSKLFCKKALVDDNCIENLQEFIKPVIERSERLPLALVVLGGLLRGMEPDQWKRILDQPREEDETLNILSLSYDYLPHHLKACFLYVAGYPKDNNIEAKSLKWKWIAEGFIKKQQEKTMEDSAEEYLQDLIQRSLIQLVKKDDLGQIELVRVHDLVLRMACKEAEDINFLHQNLSQESLILARRFSLSLSPCDDDDILRHFSCLHNHSVPKLRSLYIQCTGSKNKIPSSYINFHSTKFLRVLSLVGLLFENEVCPKAISNLIQLRYLCFAHTNLKELPYGISKLRNLQTLDVNFTDITQLPKKFWEIASLRHVIGRKILEINPPSIQDVNKLNELQTLKGIPNYRWIINDGLRKSTNIRRLILFGVYGNENTDIEKLEEKVLDAIENLKHLTFLHLEEQLASMKVLTASKTSLSYLTLVNRKRKNLNFEMNSVLQQLLLNQLHTLDLNSMSLKEDDIDVIGLLPCLKNLRIEDEYELTKLVFKEGSFSCLKQLKFSNCFKLETWEVNGVWPNSATILQLLDIYNCPILKSLPQELKVKEIQLAGNEITEDVRLWRRRRAQQSL